MVWEEMMFYIILLAKLCHLPLVDDFKMLAQNERITNYIMKINLSLS